MHENRRRNLPVDVNRSIFLNSYNVGDYFSHVDDKFERSVINGWSALLINDLYVMIHYAGGTCCLNLLCFDMHDVILKH